MSGWEKYVEQAAIPLDPDAFDKRDPQHDHWALDIRRGIARDRVRKILAAVGPLIAEDARERMVAAAGKALDREGGVEWVATAIPCAACMAAAAASGAQLIEVREEVDRKHVFNGDEADEVWADRP